MTAERVGLHPSDHPLLPRFEIGEQCLGVRWLRFGFLLTWKPESKPSVEDGLNECGRFFYKGGVK